MFVWCRAPLVLSLAETGLDLLGFVLFPFSQSLMKMQYWPMQNLMHLGQIWLV